MQQRLGTPSTIQGFFAGTLLAYQQSLELTRALFGTGIDADESVAQAEVQLQTTQAQASNLGIARAQYEHAIALLVGQAPSNFSIPVEPLNINIPVIPAGIRSQLLERRPDIAADERVMAQANAQIGVAKAAYIPTVTLSGCRIRKYLISELADMAKPLLDDRSDSGGNALRCRLA